LRCKRKGSVSASNPITIRVSEDDLAEIDRRAAARGLNRTAFFLRAVLSDELAQTAEERQLERLERRVGRLEAFLFKG
jgi:uncharacterized protein (DUF1778 family)